VGLAELGMGQSGEAPSPAWKVVRSIPSPQLFLNFALAGWTGKAGVVVEFGLPSLQLPPTLLLGLYSAHMPGGGQSRAETWSLLSDSTVDTRYSSKKWPAPTGETQPGLTHSQTLSVTFSPVTMSAPWSEMRWPERLIL
jgi:hypothetical protein